MKRFLHILPAVAVLLALAMPSVAQSRLTSTTLSAAVTQTQNFITVGSATGFTASSATGTQYIVYVNKEAMRITGVNGTRITVERGNAGTQTPHASGTRVMVGAAGSSSAGNVTGGPFVRNSPAGACTRSAVATLPVINITNGVWYNCNGGVWLPQTGISDVPNTPLVAACNIPIGSVAYASVGTNTADIADKRMTSSIYVPRTFYATGISILQGGTATTDNITGQLADSGGVVFAPGAAAGVLLAGANTFKNLPFANAQFVTGPALYHGSIVGNGTTAGSYQTVPASTFKDIVTSGTTSITFGTFPNFTPATTFTADVGTVFCIY